MISPPWMNSTRRPTKAEIAHYEKQLMAIKIMKLFASYQPKLKKKGRKK